MTDLFLVDKSAIARWSQPPVADVLDPLHEHALLAICAAVEYELVHSLNAKSQFPSLATWLRGFDYLRCDDEVCQRAVDVQRSAVDRGFHRGLSLPDLIIAATAERHGAIVLHYDRDYERIASLTGQRHQWVVPPGTADQAP